MAFNDKTNISIATRTPNRLGPAKPLKSGSAPSTPVTANPNVNNGTVTPEYYNDTYVSAETPGRGTAVYEEPLGRGAAAFVISRGPDKVERIWAGATKARINHEKGVASFLMENGKGIPNVPEILAVGENYVTMSRASGVSLTTVMESYPDGMPPRLATRIVGLVSEALAGLDRLGIAHRDVKPDNIFVDLGSEGKVRSVKLIDLFSAMPTRPNGLPDGGYPASTPEYCAPEMGIGAKPSGKADVFALGKVLYQILTGNPLYYNETGGEAGSEVERMMKTMETKTTEDVAPAIRNAPKETQPLLLKMLEPDPEARLSAGEVVGEISPEPAARGVLGRVGVGVANVGAGLVVGYGASYLAGRLGAGETGSGLAGIGAGHAAGVAVTRLTMGALPGAGAQISGLGLGLGGAVFAGSIYNAGLNNAGVAADSWARSAPVQAGVGIGGGMTFVAAGAATAPFAIVALANEVPKHLGTAEDRAAKQKEIESARQLMAHQVAYGEGVERVVAAVALGVSLVPIFDGFMLLASDAKADPK